jgi:hypothetical protein
MLKKRLAREGSCEAGTLCTGYQLVSVCWDRAPMQELPEVVIPITGRQQGTIEA